MPRLCNVLIIGLLIGILGLILGLTPIGFHLEENIGLDTLFKFRGMRPVPREVIIISIDERSAKNLSLPLKPEKWPRSLHAHLIKKLADEGAAVIAFDIFFEEARSSEQDNFLAEAIRRAGNVVLCECLKKRKLSISHNDNKQKGDAIVEMPLPPIPQLEKSALALAPFPLPELPIKVSQYWRFKAGAGDVPTLPTVLFQIFALEVYDNFLELLAHEDPIHAKKLPPDKDTIIKTKTVRELVIAIRDIFKKEPSLGKKILENLEDSLTPYMNVRDVRILKSLIMMYQGPASVYLNFYGPPHTIPTIPFYEILQEKGSGSNQKGIDFKDKAVFVGFSAQTQPEQKDGYNTTFTDKSSGLKISGVEIAATAFGNLLEGMPIQPISPWWHITVIFFWGIIVVALCVFSSSMIAAMSLIAINILYFIVVYYQFKTAGIWYPLITPVFFQTPLAFSGSILWRYFNTYKERQNTKEALKHFLPLRVADHFTKDIANIRKDCQEVYGTCLCTDGENYTNLSENIPPKELRNFLNIYYETVFMPVRKHGGIISDIKGDSMLAVWSAEHPDAVIRHQACLAALDILREVRIFNLKYNTRQLPIRIGLHSGIISLGTIGAANRFEYRPVGDIVNTVSRIEGLNKYIGTRILVTEEVIFQLDGFLNREVGKFILAGKSMPIVVHELISRIKEATNEQIELCKGFADALDSFNKQSWDEAINRFHNLMISYKNDGPSAFYLKICENCRINPPKGMWDGIIRLDKK